MSHFSVLVVTHDDSEESLEKALLPFHEFECTGIEAYVVDQDITDELRKEFEEGTVSVIINHEGRMFHKLDDVAFRDPLPEEVPLIGAGMGAGSGLIWNSKDWEDGRGYRTKVHHVPHGWIERKVRLADMMSFNEWLVNECGYEVAHEKPDITGRHMFGYVLLDKEGTPLKVVRRTNPNDKWDWWVIGGRFNQGFISRSGSTIPFGWMRDIDIEATNTTRRNERILMQQEAYAKLASGEETEGWLRMLYGDTIFSPDHADQARAWTFAILKDGIWD